jgi:H+/Cl- antiporter ClcA
MRRQAKDFIPTGWFLEESVLFISVLKWFLLASVVGLLSGLGTVAFLKSLQWGTESIRGLGLYWLLVPAAFFLSILLGRLAPEAEGDGMEKILESVHMRAGRISPLVVPVKLLATVITIAPGGSAGKEGPCAQIGAGLSSALAALLHFDERDRKKLVICGISGGFAAVFGTPIAGAIFGIEVLYVGTLLYDVLFPAFVAGIVAFHVASAFGVGYSYLPMEALPPFSGALLIQVALAGVFFGLVAFLLIETLERFELLSARLRMWPPLKGLLGGAALVLLTVLFGTGYLGLGLPTIEAAASGTQVAPLGWLIKIIFTSITLSFGGSGGIVTPLFFIGATAGNAFAQLLGMDMAMLSAMGMVAVLAGAMNTPIAASIMAVELFGAQLAPYAAMACIISFLMTGHRSVNPSQVLVMSKSPTLRVKAGRRLKEIDGISLSPRKSSLVGLILQCTQDIGRWHRQKKGRNKDKE